MVPERARAVVQVEPNHAACYWRAISETLTQLGAQSGHLEISVVEAPPPTAAAARLVVLEMSSMDLDQATLDAAVRRTHPACATGAAEASPAQPHVEPASAFSTLDEPLNGRSAVTVSWPLGQHHDQTLDAPLRQSSDGVGSTTVEAPLGAAASAANADLAPSHTPAAAAETAQSPDLGAREAPLQVAELDAAARPTGWTGVAATARSLWRRASEGLRVAGLMLLVFLLLRTLVQTFHVDGPSMNPNFETDQRLLVNKVIYWHVEGTPFEGLIPSRPQGSIDYLFGGPNRGDVVIFRPPGQSEFDSDLIKRIIGLPGDAVAIQDGQLYINGQAIDEPYIAFRADYTYPGPDLAVVVPNDSYFVLGDNRPVSADSHLGWFVPVEKLVGKAWLSYWPPRDWGLVLSGTTDHLLANQGAAAH